MSLPRQFRFMHIHDACIKRTFHRGWCIFICAPFTISIAQACWSYSKISSCGELKWGFIHLNSDVHARVCLRQTDGLKLDAVVRPKAWKLRFYNGRVSYLIIVGGESPTLAKPTNTPITTKCIYFSMWKPDYFYCLWSIMHTPVSIYFITLYNFLFVLLKPFLYVNFRSIG